MSRGTRWFLRIVLVGSIVVIGISGYKIYQEVSEVKQSVAVYDNLIEEVIDEDEAEEDSFSVDWNSLYAINSDIAGWIKQPDTVIDYPVVYSSDNSWYLRHTIYGDYDLFGTLFIDCTNNRDFVDRMTVIYGHHFSGGYDDVMFTSLDQYQNQEYYNNHLYLDYYTPEHNYKLYPIAGVVKSGTEQYVRTSFADDEDYYTYICDFINQSTFQSNELFAKEDKTIMLSSCTDIIYDGRYALICKVVEVGDDNG